MSGWFSLAALVVCFCNPVGSISSATSPPSSAALLPLPTLLPHLGMLCCHSGVTSFIITGSDLPTFVTDCVSLTKTKEGSISTCDRIMLGLPIMEIEVLDFLNNISNVTAFIFIHFFFSFSYLLFLRTVCPVASDVDRKIKQVST